VQGNEVEKKEDEVFSYYEQRAREVNRFIEMKKKGTSKVAIRASIVARPLTHLRY